MTRSSDRRLTEQSEQSECKVGNKEWNFMEAFYPDDGDALRRLFNVKTITNSCRRK